MVLKGAPDALQELDVATRMLGAFQVMEQHFSTEVDLIDEAYQTVFSEPRFLTACCRVIGAIFHEYLFAFCAISFAHCFHHVNYFLFG
jgi:hypothetical protein